MSKRSGATPDQVRTWIASGDGQGEGKNFKPFFHVRDVPSEGRSSMLKGLKTGGRHHHYVSDGEYGIHILAEWDPRVRDIREQYALLPWEETQEIADNLNIRHPTYPGTSTPIVVTSDAVLTVYDNVGASQAVISSKPHNKIYPKNAKSVRVLEKLLIEKMYWLRRKTPWCLSTDDMLPNTLINNLDILRVNVIATELDYLNVHLADFCNAFVDSWSQYKTFGNLLDTCAIKMHLVRKEAYAIFSRVIWSRILLLDIRSEPLDLLLPLKQPSISGSTAT